MNIFVLQVEDSDLSNIHIIAFRRMNQMDLSGNVVTDPKHLPTLKVRLGQFTSTLLFCTMLGGLELITSLVLIL